MRTVISSTRMRPAGFSRPLWLTARSCGRVQDLADDSLTSIIARESVGDEPGHRSGSVPWGEDHMADNAVPDQVVTSPTYMADIRFFFRPEDVDHMRREGD